MIAKSGLKGIVIVPSKKNKESFEKLFKNADCTNYEIFFDLTFEQKMKVSNRCKVCFVPSFTENFPFVVYENLNLMKVVALERVWSTEFKEVLDDLIVCTEEDAIEVVTKTMQEYNSEDIVRQHNNLIKYNKDLVKVWAKYLEKEKKFVESPKKETQIIKALLTTNSMPKSLENIERTSIDFTELVTLYRNLDWSKVIQTKQMSYYNEIPELTIKKDEIDEWI